MESNNMNNDLELMREQMQMLREKLDKQEIINDKMLRQSVKNRMSWIKKFVYLEFLLMPFIAVIWYAIKEMFDLSWWNYGLMLIMSIIDIVLDYFVNVASLKTNNIENSNLTETMQRLYKMKQIRAKQFIIMITLCAAWFAWTGIEMWKYAGSIAKIEGMMQAATYGGLGGLVIGIPIGFFVVIRIYRKMQRTNNELILQIKEFMEKE